MSDTPNDEVVSVPDVGDPPEPDLEDEDDDADEEE